MTLLQDATRADKERRRQVVGERGRRGKLPVFPAFPNTARLILLSRLLCRLIAVCRVPTIRGVIFASHERRTRKNADSF